MKFNVKKISKIFVTAVFLLLVVVPNTAVAVVVEGQVDNSSEMQSFIGHHVKDAHSWHIWGEDSTEIKPDGSVKILSSSAIHIGLPVILLDNGLITGNSDAFSEIKWIAQNGDTNYYAVGELEGSKYLMFHEKIYHFGDGLKLDSEGHPTNTRPLDFSLSKNVVSMLLSVAIIMLLFFPVARKYRRQGIDTAPTGRQNFLEIFVLFVRDEIARPNIGEKKYAKYMPYLLTIFFFVWINNLMGLVPFFPGASNVSGNIAFTAVLAGLTYLITQFSGNKDYWKHILLPPVPKALYPIMIPVEIIGTLTKPFALTIRLFANITAGHIVVLAFMGIIFTAKNIGWAGLSVPMGLFISVLELLVAFLQAFIFTMLSALFIGSAVEEHAHH